MESIRRDDADSEAPKRVTADERKYLYPVRRDLNSVVLRKGLANQEKKPYDVLAEGLLSEKSRGDWI
jgi:hypothetical protein